MHGSLIGGEWVEGAGVRQNINPSDARDVVGEFAQADREQTRAAVAAARETYRIWSGSGPAAKLRRA